MNQLNLMSTSFDNDSLFFVSPPIHPIIFKSCSAILLLIGVFGVIANVGIIYIFCTSPSIRTPFNYLLMNMILAETIIACFGIPVDTIASIQLGWKMGKGFCLTTGFVLTTLGTVSIGTLAVLSFQRFLIIKNYEWAKLRSYSISAAIVSSIWIYTFFISIPPFFGFGSFVPEVSGLTCTPDWTSREHIVYIMYWFVAGFILPLLVILISSTLTVLHLRKQRQKSASEEVKRLSGKREKRIGALILWMNISFLICWMPYGVVCICYIVGGKGFVPPVVVIIPIMAAKTSICWNPILYIIMNPQFRSAWKTLNGERASSTVHPTTTMRRRASRGSPLFSFHPQHVSTRAILRRGQAFQTPSLDNMQCLEKHRRLSLEEGLLPLGFAESAIRRALTANNVESLDKMSSAITKDLYDFSRSTNQHRNTKNSRVEFLNVESLSSLSSQGDFLVPKSPDKKHSSVIFQCRESIYLNQPVSWILMNQENMGLRIQKEDKEYFGIDWQQLEKSTGFDPPRLANAASFPEIFIHTFEHF